MELERKTNSERNSYSTRLLKKDAYRRSRKAKCLTTGHERKLKVKNERYKSVTKEAQGSA